MKTTIEIPDNLLVAAKAWTRQEHITLRSLIEKSLAATLDQPTAKSRVMPVTYDGHGWSPEFADAPWD